MAGIKEKFREYLANCVQTRRQIGKSFIIGRTAVDSYVSFAEVDKLFDYAPEQWKHIKSIFDITSSRKLLDIIEIITNDEKFKVKDSEGKSQYYRSNAIKQYYCFLKAREIFLYGDCKHADKEIVQMSRSGQSLQQIYYGAPGTGKSHGIKEQTEGKQVIRTTFHPDSDYSTFVGAYKPTTVDEPLMTVIGTKAVPVENEDGTLRTESKIVYEFVEQAFLQAYIKAWRQYTKATAEGKDAEEVFLVIEEINRGNCAQIFGDLFQLLDRGENGFSEYPINADNDLRKHLDKAFEGLCFDVPAVCGMSAEKVGAKLRSGEILLLPSNLYIWATMNTSDQSLFPIDSAFKRRWDWKYVPIDTRKEQWSIAVNGVSYSWSSFLEIVNERVLKATSSEDKQLGFYFCKAQQNVVSVETFVSKVLFYLWNDVFKDYDEGESIFKDSQGGQLSFSKFYAIDGDGNTKVAEEKVDQLLQNLGVEQFTEDENDEEETNGRVRYIINGETFKRMSYAAKEIMSRYLKGHPDLTFQEIKNDFPDSMLVHSGHRGLIVSTDTPLDSYERYYSPEQFSSSDGVTFKIYKQWTRININNIIDFAKNLGWDVKVEELDGQGE